MGVRMQLAIIGLVVVSVGSGCGPSNPGVDELADCADAVTIDGVAFDREFQNDELVDEQQLAGELGSVEAAVCGRTSDARIESTYLAVGTELREIVGHDSASRFAAVTEDGIFVYGRRAPGRPGDALDDVQRISVLSEYDASTELGRIDDAGVVDALVAELDSSAFGTQAPAGWDPQRRVFIGLVHPDGLSTQMIYDIATNAFLHGDQPSGTWATEVTEALERSGDGVVGGSSIVRSNGERFPLRLAGSCFPDGGADVVDRGELIEVDDPRSVLHVFGRLYDHTGSYVDSTAIAPPGEGFTSPGNSFEIEPENPAVSRVIIEVAFLDGSGQPSDDIELCATLDLARE